MGVTGLDTRLLPLAEQRSYEIPTLFDLTNMALQDPTPECRTPNFLINPTTKTLDIYSGGNTKENPIHRIAVSGPLLERLQANGGTAVRALICDCDLDGSADDLVVEVTPTESGSYQIFVSFNVTQVASKITGTAISLRNGFTNSAFVKTTVDDFRQQLDHGNGSRQERATWRRMVGLYDVFFALHGHPNP